MPAFSPKMHKIQFRLGLRSRLRYRELTALTRLLAGFGGKGKGKERDEEGEREVRG